LEEFCRFKLGKSYSRLHELSQNMELLGSDLYESAERIGFRAKDYRALKALPEAEQAIVKQAIESESREEVLAILEDMAAKHQAEREAAKRREEDLTADYDARGKLLEDKADRLEKTETELFRLKSLPKDADQELRLAREAEAVKALENAYMTALVGWNEFLVQVEAILNSHDVSAHTSQHVVGSVGNYCRAVNAALLQHEIPVDFEEEVSPAWMRETAQADLEAGQTNTPNVRGW
jgi:chromosome segregation ATPase